MEKKELLNEEMYERGKKKLKTISLVILLLGLLLGGSLIALGVIKTNEAKQNAQMTQDKNEQKVRTATDVQADIDSVQAQIDQIDMDITNLKTEKSKLKIEQDKIFRDDRGFSDRYYNKEEEINAKQNQIDAKTKEKSKLNSSLADYEQELWKINSGYNDTKNRIDQSIVSSSASKYVPLFIFGGMIIFVSGIISLSIYLIAKKRDISAFAIQQSMPLAQEAIEKMAPTIGDAGKTVIDKVGPSIGSAAGNIAKGIKDGLKDEDKSDEK